MITWCKEIDDAESLDALEKTLERIIEQISQYPQLAEIITPDEEQERYALTAK